MGPSFIFYIFITSRLSFHLFHHLWRSTNVFEQLIATHDNIPATTEKCMVSKDYVVMLLLLLLIRINPE